MSTSPEQKNWFFDGSPGTASRKFVTNNRPNENMFRKLFNSILFKRNAGDTAQTDEAGHVRLATDDEILNRINSSDGHHKVMVPSKMPHVGANILYCTPFDLDRYEQGYGIRVWEMQNNMNEGIGPDDWRIKYVIKIAYNEDEFFINAEGELCIKEEWINNWWEELEQAEDIWNISFDKFNFELFGDGLNNDGGNLNLDVFSDHFDFNDGSLIIKDKAITLAKLQDLDAGEVIVGQVRGDVPITMSLIGTGNILIGTSTGVEVVNIDTIISSLSIDDSSILTRKINSSTLGRGLTRDSAANDGSRMHVDLHDSASMEFEDEQLRLENDEETPVMRI